jgi:DNA-entry nuclease
MKNMKRLSALLALLLALCLCFTGCDLSSFLGGDSTSQGGGDGGAGTVPNVSLDDIPAFSGRAYVAVNGNVPFFTEDEIKSESYEYYSELDKLGRCGVVHASLGLDTMPPKNDERGEINHVKPSGWIQGQYDKDLVDGRWLYNRSHLIGWQLSDEDDNEKNLITGTRYFNVEGMLPFENMVAAHLREDGGHVMYRVTPIYEGNNLVASGVLMEAYSVEDKGEGVSFCVYIYNVQPGVIIDYATGANCLDDGYSKPEQVLPEVPELSDDEVGSYVLNTSSKRIHKPSCSSVDDMAAHNKEEYTGTITDLLAQNYVKCGSCFK